MCNPLPGFHVSLVSLDLQLVKPCSKVRGLRWARLTDGVWAWLFHRDGDLGQKWGSNLLHCESSWCWVLESPAVCQSSSCPCGGVAFFVLRALGQCWREFPGWISEVAWQLGGWQQLLLCQQQLMLWGRMCVPVCGSARLLYWRWGSGF